MRKISLSYLKATAKTMYRELYLEGLTIKAVVKIAEVGIPGSGIALNQKLREKLRLHHQAGDITDSEYKKALKLLP